VNTAFLGHRRSKEGGSGEEIKKSGKGGGWISEGRKRQLWGEDTKHDNMGKKISGRNCKERAEESLLRSRKAQRLDIGRLGLGARGGKHKKETINRKGWTEKVQNKVHLCGKKEPGKTAGIRAQGSFKGQRKRGERIALGRENRRERGFQVMGSRGNIRRNKCRNLGEGGVAVNTHHSRGGTLLTTGGIVQKHSWKHGGEN